jgi:hypothetical protein
MRVRAGRLFRPGRQAQAAAAPGDEAHGPGARGERQRGGEGEGEHDARSGRGAGAGEHRDDGRVGYAAAHRVWETSVGTPADVLV